MAITSYVMAGLGTAKLDQDYLTANARAISASGRTPSEELQNLHHRKDYRDAVIQLLTPVVETYRAGGTNAEAQRLVGQYVDAWTAEVRRQGGAPAVREAPGEQ
jgi:hypothetical protein